MDKDQMDWQKKIIREEYVHDQLQKDITLSTSQTLPKRRSKRKA
jgi:hypothetical protein